MQLLLASPNGEGPIDLTGCGERQELKQLEDNISDMMLALDATMNTISSLMKCLQKMGPLEESSPSQSEPLNKMSMVEALEEKTKEISLLLQSTHALRDKLQSTTQVVRNRRAPACDILC